MNAIVRSEENSGNGMSVGYATPGDLLRIAIEKGADLDRLEKLMDLQDRYQANQARMAYIDAMTEFKKTAPTILKNKLVEYSGTSYMHAELSDVTDAIVPGLAKVGISSAWKPEQLQGGLIRVTCVLTHKLGHSESTPLECTKDDSGKKNNIQSIGSTITYLERYTLLMATGLSTKSQIDDDGRGSEPENTGPTPEQIEASRLEIQAAERRRSHDKALGVHSESVAFIKARLAEGDDKAAVMEWEAIGEADRRALWLAPSKGGFLTTDEQKRIRDIQGKSAVAAVKAVAAEEQAAADREILKGVPQ